MSMTDLLYPSSYVRADNNNAKAWFEFLLNPDLLVEHLNETDPEPSGCALIKQFYDQANRPVNDQGQLLPPPDNERNRALKKLALQTASLLKWDLNVFDKELPIASRHQLLTEFMKACKTQIPPTPQNSLATALESMNDHTISSLILYCRWGSRTIVKSSFPCKPGGRITPTVPQSIPYQANAQQRCDEIRDQIIAILKDQVFDIVQFLEAVLHHVKRPVKMPGHKTIADDSMGTSTENESDIVISCEELHAQICYDLGCLHFSHSFYEKAREMFSHVKEWLTRVPENSSGFCEVDEATLNGYRVACQMVTKTESVTDDAVAECESLCLKIEDCLKRKGSALREMAEYIIEDIYKKELSTSYLDEVERKVLYSGDESYGGDILFDVKWTVAVRRAVRGFDQPTGLWTSMMNIAQLQRIVGIVQQVAPYVNSEEAERLGGFLTSLSNNLPEPSLVEQLLQFEVTRKFMHEDDVNDLILRIKGEQDNTRQETSDQPETSTLQTKPTTPEKLLLRTLEPTEIKEALKQLHIAASGKKYYSLVASWELSSAYVSAITTSTTDAESYDFYHIVLAKAFHCVRDGAYSTAKRMLTFVQKSCTTKSDQKIQKIATNELLKVEVMELLDDKSLHYSDREECSELRNQLGDVVTRCRHLLATASDQSKQANLPPILVPLCAAMLLNLEDLSFFMSASRGPSSAPCLRIACLLSLVRAGVIDRSLEPRKAVHDLWSAAMGIYATAAPLASSMSGRGSSKKQQTEPLRNLLPSNAIIARPEFLRFIKLLRNPHLMQIVLSLLVHLHRLCRTDILSDITVPDANVINALWPTGLDGAPLSGPCVTLALRETLAHCLTLQPQNRSWLRTLADVHYAFSNYGAALRSYLLLGAYVTNYFTDVPSNGPYDDDQIIQRMIKCCMHMKCFTQAAVLCQLTKEVDYQTAFKALQENRECCDAVEYHLSEHIWNVQILEHATFERRESGENGKKSILMSAISRPELNHNNPPKVGARVKQFRMCRFFQAMSRQYLCR
uniref:Integrator complex subunit 8-like n=1 Tax=Phallusia mammillata TaxID=59560 RepID=A0A6F9DRE2_9ASCI|nr:integrator complex subunit 8-like [Phallusia mammillata]